MALTVTLDDLRASVRKFANVQGTTAALRHPDADVNDYINRALGALHRRLTLAVPDQRYLSSSTIATTAGQAVESLPEDFAYLISVEIQVDGRRYWMQAYEMHERPVLADPSAPTNGIPLAYRLRGETIEFLPEPGDAYSILLWYVPTVGQLSGGSDEFDTIARLDEFVIAYASRPIAIKDKNWDLASACKGLIEEVGAEVDAMSRNRDRNSPSRIVDVYGVDRWGRNRRFRR